MTNFSDSAAERLRAAVERLEDSLAGDLLEGYRVDTIVGDVEWINDAHRRARIARRTSIGDSVPQYQPGLLGEHGSTAYAAGYYNARAFRAHAGIGTRVVPDMADLLRNLGWADTPLIATEGKPSARLRAVVDHGRDDVPVLTAYPPADETSQRFLLARSLSSKPPPRRRNGAWSLPPTHGTSAPRGHSPQNSLPPQTRSAVASAPIPYRPAKSPSTPRNSWSIRS